MLVLSAVSCARAPMPLDLTPAATQPAGEIALRFAWPDGAVARVREEVQRGDHVATLDYELVVATDGDMYTITPRAVTIAALDGQRVLTDDDREATEVMRATMAAGLPPLRVDATGAFVGVDGFDAWATDIATAVEQLAKSRESAEQRALEGVLQMLRSPSNRQTLEQAAGDRWETWVGVWRGYAGPAGDSGVRKTRVFVPWSGFGTEVELPFRFPGHVVRPAELVRLELSGEVTPEVTGNVLTRALASAALGDLKGMKARITRLAVLDPASMLPRHAEFHRRISRPAEGGEREAVEIRMWTFSWQIPGRSGE